MRMQPKYVLKLGIEEFPLSSIGGKAAGIITLQKFGLRVPAAYVIRAEALIDLLRDRPGVSNRIVQQDLTTIVSSFRRDNTFSTLLRDEIANALDEMCQFSPLTNGVMVRSSATNEDILESPAPGVFESVVCDPSIDAVIDALCRVWASAFTVDALIYAHRDRCTVNPDMAVILQSRIVPENAGIVYTLDPTTSNPEVCVVSWTAGDSRALLRGDILGNTTVVKKSKVADRIASNQIVRPPFVREVALAAMKAEQCSGYPVDIEFIESESLELYFVQLRRLRYRPPWESNRSLIGPIESQTDLHSAKIRAAIVSSRELGANSSLFVIRPQAFERFKGHRTIDPDLVVQLRELFYTLVASGPVSIRPAYWSAYQSGDSLPQSGRLSSVDECFTHLIKIWSFILDENLDDYSAEIALICGNWLPVIASAIALALPGDDNVQIFTVPERLEALEKGGYRRITANATSGLNRELDSEMANIDNRDAHLIAKMARNAALESRQAVRAEFLIVSRPDNSHYPRMWQIELIDDIPEARMPLYIRSLMPGEASSTMEMQRGIVLRITGNDLSPLESWKERPEKTLLVVDLNDIEDRNRGALVRLAGRCRAFGSAVALETSPLSHVAALLREYGLRVWPVERIDPDIRTGCLAAIERGLRWSDAHS